MVLRLKDIQVFLWQSVEILSVYNNLTLKTDFLQIENLFQKTGVPFFSWKY